MFDLSHFPLRLAPRRLGVGDAFAGVAAALGLGPFASMSDAKLADHHWASESALLRAVRCGKTQSVAELTRLVRSMEREMRRRGLV